VIEQYRDELLMSLQGNLDEQQVAEDREVVASDLLNILHRYTRKLSKKNMFSLTQFFRSIPIQSIATNGPSLVHKVRFVASTLLDAVRKAETAPASAARAHAYLCKDRTDYLYCPELTWDLRGFSQYPLRNRKELFVSELFLCYRLCF
jgi:hypothetical protein